jgi:ABC-type Fe3+-siderophore transport system permease subunit
MAYRPRPRWLQCLGGVLIATGSAGATAWGWHTGYNGKGTALFPCFFVIGVGLILFPGYKEERLARGEDISKLSGVDLITPRWWAVLVVGLAAGIANFMLSRE